MCPARVGMIETATASISPSARVSSDPLSIACNGSGYGDDQQSRDEARPVVAKFFIHSTTRTAV